MKDETLYLSAYNEIFIHTKGNYFDRNQFFGGLGYRFNQNIRAEIGVLNQTLTSSSRNQLNLITFINF